MRRRSRAAAHDARVDIETIEHATAESNPESRIPNSQLQRQPRRAARQPLAAHEHARRLAPFEHALQPQPRRERKTADRIGRRVGGVEGDEAEVAGLQDKRERVHRLLERALIQIAAEPRIHHDVAANPEQPIEIQPGRLRRPDVEAIEHIDERDELAARGRRGEHPQQEARAPRGSRADQLRQLPARQAAAQSRVERRKAGGGHGEIVARAGAPRGGRHRRQRRRQRAIELPGPKQRFEVGARESKHCLILCVSLYLRLQAQYTAASEADQVL